jgi:hypothetical protein
VQLKIVFMGTFQMRRILGVIVSLFLLFSSQAAHAGQGYFVDFYNMTSSPISVGAATNTNCWQPKDFSAGFTIQPGAHVQKYTEASNSAGYCNINKVSSAWVPITLPNKKLEYFQMAQSPGYLDGSMLNRMGCIQGGGWSAGSQYPGPATQPSQPAAFVTSCNYNGSQFIINVLIAN